MLNLISKRSFTAGKFQASYCLLKVRRTSTKEQIRDSYLKLCKIHHPDNVDSGNHRKFVQLQEAYERIKEAPLLDASNREYPSLNKDYDLSHEAQTELKEDDEEEEAARKKYSPIARYQSMLYHERPIKFSIKLRALCMQLMLRRRRRDDERMPDF